MAHETAKNEASQENADQGGGHAKDAQQKVANGQIEQEDSRHLTGIENNNLEYSKKKNENKKWEK
ncbi:hypothetical protein TYRP_006582 [Tyrophagus putrescentiae]|nr:hypothetical protein TYRP_006582 [Tyrophagus putrescentiae]